jgi:hypothetical protein
MPTPDIKRLNTSWTKYSAVQVVDIIYNNQSHDKLEVDEKIDESIIRAFLGIDKIEDHIPYYWVDIKKYPKQLRLFSLVAALFTHHQVISNFANKYSHNGKMTGLFEVEANKTSTNIRQALVRSGAAIENYIRSKQVPYDFTPLFESGEVGLLARDLFKDRLLKIGYSQEDLSSPKKIIEVAQRYNFHKALSLTKEHFSKWLKGQKIDPKDVYSFSQLKIYKELDLLRVNQWLNDWDDIDFSDELRNKPKPHYYIFSIDARLLKRLSDVHRRKPNKARSEDTAIQRASNESRIKEIGNYIEGGFPWSTLSEKERFDPQNFDLKMPGLLPTAIIANILKPGDIRNNGKLEEGDQIRVVDNENNQFSKLIIPDQVFEDNWNPSLKPIEIIDGQHRLWAFDENDPISGNYEVPVVVFDDLDRTWQAYLFYTINVKPVKINTSLGYDLYPLLRTQKWLERSKEGAFAYRETRAQELVEALWLYPDNPWYQRINMIGETGGPAMSQAAFIRALTFSFLKSKGSLFGSEIAKAQVLDWNRTQQAAFLILMWRKIAEYVSLTKESWAESLRKQESELQSALFDDDDPQLEPAFFGKHSFISRDQGVRGISLFANDFFFVAAQYDDINFNEFISSEELSESAFDAELIEDAMQQFTQNVKLLRMIEALAEAISRVDWRSSMIKGLDDETRRQQMIYKGSSGYREVWRTILKKFKELEVEEELDKYLNQVEKLG